MLQNNFSYILSYLDKFISTLEKYLQHKWWYLSSSAIIALIVLFINTPGFQSIGSKTSVINNLAETAFKFKFMHPLSPIPIDELTKDIDKEVNAGYISHLDKRNTRVTVFIIGYLLHFDIIGSVVMQQILAYLFICMSMLICYRFTEDKVCSILLTFSLMSTTIGGWLFADFYYYDTYAYFFLLASVYFRNPFVVFICLLSSFFVDERAVIASTLVGLWWQVQDNKMYGKNIVSLFKLSPQLIALGIAILMFIIIRYYMATYLGLTTGTSRLMLPSILRTNLTNSLQYVLSFESLWLLIAILIIYLCKQKNILLLFLCGASITLIYMAATMVDDFARSAAYGFLIFFIAFYLLFDRQEQKQWRYLLCFLLFLNMTLAESFPSLLRHVINF